MVCFAVHLYSCVCEDHCARRPGGTHLGKVSTLVEGLILTVFTRGKTEEINGSQSNVSMTWKA